ncbi:MAG: polysaccharide biosynthesis tyrosine autokinase [bacterium]|nr:polysaccharide biosynthesis tyrosine autokinase [bacterium]
MKNTEDKHFLDYWRIVRKRKGVVIATVFIVTFTTAIVSFIMTPRYFASCKIRVVKQKPTVDVFGKQYSMMSDYDPIFFGTQSELIQSEPILLKVIDDLSLAKRWFGARDDFKELGNKFALRRMKYHLRVKQFRGTDIIEIAFEDYDQEKVAVIANTIAGVFRDERLRLMKEKVEEGLDNLSASLSKSLQELVETDKELEEAKKRTGLAYYQGVSIDKQKLTEYNDAYIQAQMEAVLKKTEIDELMKLSPEEQLYTLSVGVKSNASHNLTVLKQRLAEAKVERSVLLEDYGNKHPLVLQAKSKIEEIEDNIAKEIQGIINGLKTEYEVARVRAEELHNVLENVKKEDQVLDEKQLEVVKLVREVETNREVYMTLKKQLNEEIIAKALPVSYVEIVEPAVRPVIPSKPRKALNIALGLVFGLVLGTGFAYFMEYLDTSIKTVDDIEEFLGLPILGVIPQKIKILFDEKRNSLNYESYRIVRTNLDLILRKNNYKTITVTSAGAGEGKSTTIVNMGIVLARAGKKVIILDADIRKPKIAAFFGAAETGGLGDVLKGKLALDSAVQNTSEENLKFIPCGKTLSGFVGLLSPQKIKELIAGLKDKSDIILIDAPPLIGVSDSSMLVNESDAVILVVQHRKYPKDMAKRAVKTMRAQGVNVIGAVLNNINFVRDDDYYKHYAYYYHDAENEKT